MNTTTLPPLHPGKVLREEFLVPMKLSARSVAMAVGLPRSRIERIAAEKYGMTADTAVRLAKYFGTSAEMWLNLQTDYDVQIAKKELKFVLNGIKPREATNGNLEPAEYQQRA